MANAVDSRIVEMQFDGKDFDKGIRQSQKTLEDFKKSLNFDDAAKQMSALAEGGSIGNAITSMATNLSKLTNALTGVGKLSTYVAQKIQKAWQGALGEVEKFTKSMTSAQFAAGSEKYDKLLKSVQTIKNATGDTEETVYAAMEELNKYTDQTSYNFSDMAQNIGKFTTVGINLSDAEKEMEGIANWAALAGQGVNEAQRAMYNISQAMSAGYMQKIDWKSIQNANMDIRKFRQEALDAAVAAGTLKKSKDGIYKTVKGGKQVDLNNFTETLQYKWFDKKTMETVFKTFADNTQGIGEEAYKAAQRCVTFSDAINAWKDMLSTGWMKSYQHVFGKLSDAMALFSGVCDKVTETLQEFSDIRNDILKGWNEGGGRNSFWGALFGELETPDGEILFKGAYGLLDAFQDVVGAIKEAFWDFLGNFVGPFNEALYGSDKEAQGKSFLSATLMELSTRLQEFTGRIKEFLHGTEDGETESRLDRIKTIAQAVFATVKLVVDVFKGIFNFANEVGKQLSPAITAIEQLISYLLQLFTGDVVQGAKQNTIGNFFHTLAELMKPVTAVINVVVKVLAALIAQIVTTAKQSGLLTFIGDAFKFLGLVMARIVSKIFSSGIIQKIFGWISTAISKLPALITKLRALGATLVSTFQNSKVVKGAKGFFTNLFGGKNLSGILDSLKETVKKLLKKIPEIFASIKSGSLLSKISGFFSNLLGNIFGVGSTNAEGSEAVAEQMAEAVAKPIEELGKSDVIGKAIDKVKPSFLQNLKTKLTELWSKISEFFTSIANSEAIKKIGKFFEGTNFQNLLGSAKEILKYLAIFRTGSGLVSAGKGLKSLGKGIKIFGKNLKNLDLKNIFSNSNNTDNSKHTSFENLGNSMLKIAVAIAAVAGAAYVLSKLKPDELKQAGISLGIIITALVGASWLAKKIGGNGGSLLALAAGILILLAPLKILQAMKWDALLDGVAKLAVVMFSLALALKLAGNTKTKGFIGLAAALTLILIPLKVLMNMPIGSLSKGGGLIQGIIALQALMWSMAFAAKIAGNTKPKGFLGIAAALTLLMVPFNMIVKMKWYEALQGVLAIGAIIAAMTAMIKMSDGVEVSKLSGIVGAIVVLTAIGTLIGSTMDWKQVVVGFVPIIAMLGFMTSMLKAAKNLTPQKIKGLTSIFYAFMAVVIAISAAIVVLSVLDVDITTMSVFLGGIIGMIAAFGIMCKLIGSANSKAVAQIAGVFGVFTAVILAVGGSLVAMSYFKTDWTLVAAFLGGISLMLAMVGVMIKLGFKTNSKGLAKVVGVLGVMTGLIAAAGGILALMSVAGVDWKDTIAFLGGLSVFIAAMGLFLPGLSKLDPVGAIKAIGILSAAVVAIGAALAIIIPIILGSVGNAMTGIATRMKLMGGLFKDFFGSIDGVSEDSINHAMLVFEGIKSVIMKFVGFGNFEKDLRSVLSQLNYLGAGLDAFFLNEAKYPDPESSKAFMTLNKLIEMSPSFAAFSVGNLPEQLMYLGVGLMLFNEATKDITTAEVPALAMLQGIFGQTENIEKFSKLPINEFAGQMSGLGGAMSLYAKGAKEVTGISADEDAPDITAAIGILKAVCNSLSGEDGEGEFKIPENMPDSAALGLFAGQLEALGNALSNFATAAKSMETDTSKALALLGFLAQIGGYITPDNLKVFDAFGEDMHVGANGEGGKLGQFSLDIGALGTSLSSFAQNVGGKEAEFTTGLGVLKKLSELNTLLTADKLKFVNSFKEAGLNDSILGQFATDIGALGHALATFASNVLIDGKPANFDNALDALGFLARLQIKLSSIKLGGLVQLIEGNSATLGLLSTDIIQLGGALSEFSKSVTGSIEGSDPFNAEATLAAMDVLGKMMGVINAINVDHAGDWGGITDKAERLIQFFSMLFDPDVGASTFVDGSFIEAIASFAQDLTTVFNSTEGIDPNAIDIWQKLIDGISSLVLLDVGKNFEYPGSTMAEGIATGIRSGEESVLTAIAEVVGLINDAITNDLDLQPTITPVLCLDNITGAEEKLHGIFEGYSLDLGNALEKATAAASKSGPSEVIVQNPADLSGIQSSIVALQNNIIGLQSAISNIKIVLNTGVIAGGVTDDVDRNLGTKSLYASRRN